MVAAPGQQALFGGEPAPGPRPVVPRARTLKTASGLLYDVLAGVYADLGFDALGDEVFRDLVIARVVEPTSLLDVDRVLAEMGRVSASLSTRKRTLRRCFDGNYRDRLAELCFTHVLACGDISLVLYDVTTSYADVGITASMPTFWLCRCPVCCCRSGVLSGFQGRHNLTG